MERSVQGSSVYDVGENGAAFKRQSRNEGVTEIQQVPNRGHSLTIDSGWREVADTALAFVERYAGASADAQSAAATA